MATFVLVHGTTGGGWVWKTVAQRLRDAGHEVHTPTLTGLGERVHLATPQVNLDTHITDIANVLEYEGLREVVLVGHSYGGMVIAGVADCMPERIAHLVYLDAMAPRDGESLLDLMPPEHRHEMEERVRTEGHGWLIPVNHGPNDLPAKNTPHPYATWTQPLRLCDQARVLALPSTYVRFTADKQPGSYLQRAFALSWTRAQDAGWRLRQVHTTHPIWPDPEPKAAVLLELFADR